jgi:hypothetical protein
MLDVGFKEEIGTGVKEAHVNVGDLVRPIPLECATCFDWRATLVPGGMTFLRSCLNGSLNRNGIGNWRTGFQRIDGLNGSRISDLAQGAQQSEENSGSECAVHC